MAALATAFVRIRARTDSLKGDIEKGLRGANPEKEAERKGSASGRAFTRGFNKGASTFTTVAATMASRATILTSGLTAAAAASGKFVAAIAPATGILAGVIPAAAGATAVTKTFGLAVAGVGDAINKGLYGSATAYNNALEDLSPTQQAITKQIVAMKDRIQDVREQVSSRFFAPLLADIEPLASTYLPLAGQEMGGLAGQLGLLAQEVVKVARSSTAIGTFRAVFTQSSRSVAALRDEVGPLTTALLNLLRSSTPLIRDQAGSLERLLQSFTRWADEAARTGQLIAWYQRAKDTIADLAAIFRNLGAITKAVFGPLLGDSGTLLDRLVSLTGQARAFVESTKGSEALKNLFATLGVLAQSLRQSLAGVLPQVGESLQIAAPAAAALAQAVSRLLVAFGPLLPALTQSAAVIATAFVPVLNTLAGFLERNQGLLQVLAPFIVAYGVAMKASAVYTAAHTVATRANAAAVAFSKTTTGTWLGVKALEAGAWIKSTAQTIASTTATAANRIATAVLTANLWGLIAAKTAELAGWVRSAAATVASTAAIVAHTIASKAVRAATIAWTGVQWALNVALNANPIGLVVIAITALIAIVVLAYQRNETFRKVVQAVWAAVRTAIRSVVDWFVKNAWPQIQAALRDLETAWNVLRKVVDVVWSAIRWYIQTYWAAIRITFNAVRTFITETLPNAFNSGRNYIVGHWNAVRNAINAGWTTIRGYFTSLRDFITVTLPNAFASGVTAIGKAWSRVREEARRPVTFVVNSVMNPLIRGYNRIADVFGAPKASEITGFASGGRIPGAPSDRDNRIATVMDKGRQALGNIKVATGEFIVNTKSTAANLPLIQAINAARGKLQLPGVDPHLDGASRGGRVMSERKGDGIGDFLGNVWNGIKGVGSYVTNPVDGLKRAAAASLARIPGSGSVVNLVKAMTNKVVTSLGTWLRKNAGGAIGGGGIAGGWRGMQAAISRVFPQLQLISGFRPGARTLSGNQSYHALGRAVDYPPSRPLAAWIRATYGAKTKELITPFQDLNLHNGRPHTYTGAVWNQHNFAGGNAHVHWAARLGGLVDSLNNAPIVKLLDRGGSWPSGTLGLNASGYNETVLTGGPNGDMAELRDLLGAILVAIKALGGEVAEALERPTRRAVQLGRSGANALGG